MKVPALLFNDTCTVKPYTGQTPAGPGFGTEFTSKCRPELKRKRYELNGVTSFVNAGKIYLPVTDDTKAILPESLITVGSLTAVVKGRQTQKGFSESHVELDIEEVRQS